MEPFFDGGMFELLTVFMVAGLLNFIFLRKYLLLAFCALMIVSPVFLFFVGRTEIYYWLVSVCLLNSVLAVVLLWKQKRTNPSQELFETEGMKKKFIEFKEKMARLFAAPSQK